ncbi:hypothetical protein HELRODRAFT_63861 [Helobdella robusta]|uniref:Uncharacterized protein n=1 Tax=Helobdella robusta TaxID=6412 RepID=T1FXL2_HELRO|nr:hypothetical protein HELRODRAFT_63861 [Helobdella robusta]ESO06608.1 hypothetical protein HELRODRAFT_63861 [Helobdella robusta]
MSGKSESDELLLVNVDKGGGSESQSQQQQKSQPVEQQKTQQEQLVEQQQQQTENNCNTKEPKEEEKVEDTSKNKNELESTPTLTNVQGDRRGSRDKGTKKGTHKKRVTFPEGDEVVSGYMDPPIPWHHSSQCTTEKLVRSYLRSCDKLGIRHNPKVLKQLQAINNFELRNETFSLRSDYLDVKYCESLEEIFKRVQFRTIDLEAARIEDDVTSLQVLDLKGTNVSEHLMPFMARAFKFGTSLTVLHLEYTMPSGKALSTLVLALKGNETLRELYLGENKLTSSDASQISALLRQNRTLQLLDLRSNCIQDTGMGHLCDGLSSGESGLETLVVWGNQLTYQSMVALSRVLMVSKSLLGINLGLNGITNEGIHRLKDGLVRNRTLVKIGMQACKISCEGAVALAEYIAETTKLLRLDLRENDIKTAGLMALSLALKVNKSVVRVDLDKEYKKESVSYCHWLSLNGQMMVLVTGDGE